MILLFAPHPPGTLVIVEALLGQPIIKPILARVVRERTRGAFIAWWMAHDPKRWADAIGALGEPPLVLPPDYAYLEMEVVGNELPDVKTYKM
jgi:hypothetical protein